MPTEIRAGVRFYLRGTFSDAALLILPEPESLGIGGNIGMG